MAKKHKCQVVLEDADAVTVRKGGCLADQLADAMEAHLGDPLLFLALTASGVYRVTGLERSSTVERQLTEAFVMAAETLLATTTARWDAEEAAERERQEQRDALHADSCECGECPATGGDAEMPDERQRLLEEEVRAAAANGDMTLRDLS